MLYYHCKSWKAIFCYALLILLAGCAKVPEEVLDEINDTENWQEVTEVLEQTDEGIVYTKVSELSESVPEYMTTTIGNLSFDGTITVPDTDCLYDLRLVANTSFYDNRDTLIPDILAWYQIPYEDENIEIECWVDHGSETYIGLQGEETPDDIPGDFIQVLISDLHIGVHSDGTMVWVNRWGIDREYQGINHFWHENVEVEAYETWHLWNHEIPEIEIVFNEEHVSLQELYDDFSQVVELYNRQNDSLGFQIYSASYYQTEEQDVCVQLEAVQTYRGVCFDPVSHHDYSLVIDASGRSLVSGRLKGMYHCRKDRCLFGLYDSSYIPVEELAVYDKVVSLDSALDLLAERLGDYYIADVEEASLFYLRYYYGTYGYAWGLWEEEPITAYAHPYWRFVERSDGNDSFKRTVYYVDAITGEVMCLYENCVLY